MLFRARPRVLLGAVAVGLLCLVSPVRPEDRVLFKIERAQPAAVPDHLLAEVSGLVELTSGWIADAPGTVVTSLRAAGVALTVLDPAPAGKRYFLVFLADAADAASISPPDTVTRLEPRVCLVAAADEDLRARLPRRLSLARLSLSPAAGVRPVFDVAGRTRAVPRAGAIAALEAADPRIAAAVANVSRDRLASTIRTLESYQTRYASTTTLTAVGNSLYDQFRQLGVAVEYDDFTFAAANYPAANVVATIPGRLSPQDVVILCAHYDSYSDQRPSVAPGADDNATGTAAVLEAARVLAGMSFDFSVRLIAFSAEEWGLYGSKHYAQAAKARGERIVAVVNLDMIGYADAMPEDLDVTANGASEWLVDRFASAAAAYTPLTVNKHVNASARSSDHAPFWDQGYSAVECIEDDPLRNPYYHRVTDRFETLTMAFVELATRGAVAVVADLAQPASVVAGPTGLDVQTETYRSLFSTATRSVLSWSAPAGAAGYNVYRATVSHGAYRRLNSVPVKSTTFVDAFVRAGTPSFYVVTAVDGQGRESNYSSEVSGQ